MAYEHEEVNTEYGERSCRNKDVITLCRVLYAMQGAYAAEIKRQWQQDRLYNISQKLTGMPTGKGGTGGLDRQFAKISELEERYREECDEYIKALDRANAILDGIKNDMLKVFVTLKYVIRMSDREIMARLNMTRRSFNALRHRIEDAPDMNAVKWPSKGVY